MIIVFYNILGCQISMTSKKILHLLSAGGMGGIEMLCRDLAKYDGRDENEFCFLYGGGIIEQELIQMGKSVYSLYHKSHLERVIRLVQIVVERKYDVVVVHHEGNGIYLFFLILCTLFPRKRFIKYLHCAYEEQYVYSGNRCKNWLTGYILKQCMKRADMFVAVSEFVGKSYCDAFRIEKKKMRVIYNGIQLNTNAAQRKTRENDIYHLLYIGRVVEIKGIELLIRAVYDLCKEGHRIELEIVGDGVAMERCQVLCHELHIQDKIFFRGIQMNKEPYFNKADIFVYPSICQEAFGISIIEAMDYGVICIASDVGGIPEIITDGVDGYLFQRNDTVDLEQKISLAIRTIENVADNSMRLAARQRAKDFSINRMVTQYQEIVNA